MNTRVVFQTVGFCLLAVGIFCLAGPITTAGGPPIRLAIGGPGYVTAETLEQMDRSPTSGLIPTRWETNTQLIPTEIQSNFQLVTPVAPTASPVATMGYQDVAPESVNLFLNRQFRSLTPQYGPVTVKVAPPTSGPWTAANPAAPAARVTKSSRVAKVPQSASRRRLQATKSPEEEIPQQK